MLFRTSRHLIAYPVIAYLMILAPSAFAQADPETAKAFRTIISSQIDAFQRDAGSEAFAHASPTIKQMFGSPDNFMKMVRQGYPQVYRPKTFEFGQITKEMNGRPTQRVHIIDQSGQSWTALYAFELQPDGTWRIAGVVMLRQADVNA